MDVKRSIRNSILSPALMIRDLGVEKSAAIECAGEISYLRGLCGVTRWEGEGNSRECMCMKDVV